MSAEVRALILCDFAQARGNLLTVVSGGISQTTSAVVPTVLNLMVAIVVEVPPLEVGLVHELKLRLQRVRDSKPLVEIVAALKVELHQPQLGQPAIACAAADLRGAVLDEFGGYEVWCSVDGGVGTDAAFWLVESDAAVS